MRKCQFREPRLIKKISEWDATRSPTSYLCEQLKSYSLELYLVEVEHCCFGRQLKIALLILVLLHIKQSLFFYFPLFKIRDGTVSVP
jgi:hypothetical protein